MNKRTDEVQRKLNILAADVAVGKITQVEAKNTLESMDVYLMETVENENVVVPYSTGTDITMNNVWVSYDSSTSRWTVTGGGYWKTTAWYSDAYGTPPGIPGIVKNVGGTDAVGITYYNTSGKYNTAVVSSLGYVTDHNGWSDYMYNPSHGDGKYGVAFEYQDKVKSTTVYGICSASDHTYYGSGFSASVTYDSKFADYNGYARAMYAHTWSSTTINSIGFNGGGGSFGATIGWSSSSNKFSIFSNADTIF